MYRAIKLHERQDILKCVSDNPEMFIYLLLKSCPKYKIDKDRNKTHDTDKNIKT